MGPFDFLHVLVLWSFAPLAVIVAMLHVLENPEKMYCGGNLSSTPLYQACMGQKWVVLHEELEFAALAKSITHARRTKGWAANKFYTKLDSLGVVYLYSHMQVGLVSVDESQDVADVPLCIEGEDIQPELYVLTCLKYLPTPWEPTDNLNIEALQTFLMKRKHISDKVLDAWINPMRKTSAVKKDPTENIIREWCSKTKWGVSGWSSIICQFQRMVLSLASSSARPCCTLSRPSTTFGTHPTWSFSLSLCCCLCPSSPPVSGQHATSTKETCRFTCGG